MSGPVRDARRPGWLWVDHAILLEHGAALGATGIATYVGLASYANSDQVAWPGLRGLAARLGMGRSTVARALRTLEARGLIAIERHQGAAGDAETNRYVLQRAPLGGWSSTGTGVPLGDHGVPLGDHGGGPPEGQNKKDSSCPLEQEPQNKNGAHRAPCLRSEFELFWSCYPPRDGRRDKKAEAWAEWQRLRPSPDLQATLRAALGRYRTEKPVDAVRWLKHRRWEDDVGVTPPATTRPRAMAAGGVPMLTYEESLARRQREGRA